MECGICQAQIDPEKDYVFSNNGTDYYRCPECGKMHLVANKPEPVRSGVKAADYLFGGKGSDDLL